jgi:O-antigen/teichoic acid export membrane protein
MGGFGLNVLGAKLASFANSATDTILIGRFLGPASVGPYAIAFNLMLFPLMRVVGPIRDITFPAFSRLQDDVAALAAGWLRATRLVTAVVAPAMLGMVVVAPDFVPVVLGDKWLDAVPVIQALSWVGLMLAIQQVGGSSALLARDKSGTVFRFTIAMYAANVAAFAVGLAWGIVGVAVAYALVATIFTALFALTVARAVESSLGSFARHVAPPLLAGFVMAGAVTATRLTLVEIEVAQGLRLAACVGVGIALYIPLAARLVPELVTELRRLVTPRRPTVPTP